MIEIINLVLLAIVCVLLIALFLRKKDEGNGLLERKVDELERFLVRIENALRDDFRNNREELANALEKNSRSQIEKLEALISKIEEKNKENKDSIEHDGVTYPLVKLEISRTSHPFYTGQNMLVDTAGRIDKFKKKYAKK